MDLSKARKLAQDEFSREIYNYLIDEIYSHPLPRKNLEWRMNSEWMFDCRTRLRDPGGRPLWEPQQFYGPDLLLGFPFSTDESYSTPVLIEVFDADNG